MQYCFKKIFALSAVIAALSLSPQMVQAQQTVITYYNFANNTTTYTTPISQTSGTGGGALTSTFTTLSNVAGTNTVGSFFITDNTSPTGAFSANGSAIGFTTGTASTNNIQFSTNFSTVTDPTGLILSYAAQRSNTGAVTQTVTYSTDGTTFSSFANNTFTVPTAYALASYDISSLGLAGQANVTFRITPSGGTGTSGTNRIDNLFVGTVAPAPEPGSMASLLIGFGALGLLVARRRRAGLNQTLT